MSALPTPKLADLDDPLAPSRQQIPRAADDKPARGSQVEPEAPAQQTSAAVADPPTLRSLADEPLAAVFARLPESLTDRLAEGVRAINADRPRRARVSQQDVLGALVDEYVTPGDVDELAELVEDYRRRVRR